MLSLMCTCWPLMKNVGTAWTPRLVALLNIFENAILELGGCPCVCTRMVPLIPMLFAIEQTQALGSGLR